jgi:PhzF family phenazine biosynthesis protein
MAPRVRLDVTIVDACVRDDHGGSPTGVVLDDPELTDAQRQRIAGLIDTSHVAFIAPEPGRDAGHDVRFFASEGELLGCGHGTVAAQAVLLAGSAAAEYRGQQRTGPRTLEIVAVHDGASFDVWFDQGVVALTNPSDAEQGALLAALGLQPRDLHPDEAVTIASPGTPRLLVPVADADTLRSISPDFGRLTTECQRAGLLGCFVYLPPVETNLVSARMFAPAIGVREDIANANSTGCLAAQLLASRGIASIRCHQGDSLGRPSTITASASQVIDGVRTRVGGRAIIRRQVSLLL